MGKDIIRSSGKVSIDDDIPSRLRILPVRRIVLFPGMMVPLYIKDDWSTEIINKVMAGGRMVGVMLQKNEAQHAHPRPADMYSVGTVCRIVKMIKPEDGALTILIQGMHRFKIKKWLSPDTGLAADITLLEDIVKDDTELKALRLNMKQLASRAFEMDPHIPPEVNSVLRNIQDSAMLSDLVSGGLNIGVDKKQELLELLDVKERLKRIAPQVQQQLEVMELGSKIHDQVKESISDNQRKYYLREQMKAIQEELGENDDLDQEVEELEKKIETAKMPQEADKEARKQLSRLSIMSPAAPDYSLTKTYIDWLVELPWSTATEDMLDVTHARKILDEDHYGLEKVKQRILEFLSVRKLKNDLHGPILCFSGPPGVGKTSLGKSIARALGREFVRISLGGVRDEAEIRGHRRTYIGALPGRIIQGLKKAGTNNPVFMLDEIDKLGNDFRGDPSSALLEVLDPEQNNSFSDHYLNVAFDLSKVMFITTANRLDTIPGPLRDRMELLPFTGYTLEEKVSIARKYLVKRQRVEHGLKTIQIGFNAASLREIAASYTREAGVRTLEREIATVVRGVAHKVAEGKARKKIAITAKNVAVYLGPVRYVSESAERTSLSGVATGLAWTPVGGEILFVEASRMPGKGQLLLTGHLGEVMRESAQAAMSYIRSSYKKFKVDPEMFKKNDFHVHVPAGAIPKDGPSAGVTMFTAIISVLLNRRVRHDVAMTGEITLRGAVLPIGGLKEKALAARQAGIMTILIPIRNKVDLQEIPEKIRKGMTFVPVKTMFDVFRHALVKEDL